MRNGVQVIIAVAHSSKILLPLRNILGLYRLLHTRNMSREILTLLIKYIYCLKTEGGYANDFDKSVDLVGLFKEDPFNLLGPSE